MGFLDPNPKMGSQNTDLFLNYAAMCVDGGRSPGTMACFQEHFRMLAVSPPYLSFFVEIPHSRSTLSEDQASIGVPPQEDSTSPMGYLSFSNK